MGINRNIGQLAYRSCHEFHRRIDTVIRKGGATAIIKFIHGKGFRVPTGVSFAPYYRLGHVYSLGL